MKAEEKSEEQLRFEKEMVDVLTKQPQILRNEKTYDMLINEYVSQFGEAEDKTFSYPSANWS